MWDSEGALASVIGGLVRNPVIAVPTSVGYGALVKLYREQVNPRVNVFCIQTAGYSNVLVPERDLYARLSSYRGAALYNDPEPRQVLAPGKKDHCKEIIKIPERVGACSGNIIRL